MVVARQGLLGSLSKSFGNNARFGYEISLRQDPKKDSRQDLDDFLKAIERDIATVRKRFDIK